MNIIGVDIGFSSCKVTLGNEYGEISKKFKFSSLIGITKKIDAVENSKIKKYDDNYYMVGDDAQHLPSANMIDITEYKNLEYYAPLLLQHAIEKCGVEPDIVVTGLSIAQIGNSGYFQAQLEKYTIDDKEYVHDTVYVLPQGAGAKLTVDRYGARFPEEQKEFNGNKNYIICDIGFNTIDYLLVNNGKTDPNLFNADENAGIMKISKQIAQEVNKQFKRQITLQEAREVIDTGFYKLRGKKHDFKEFVENIKKEYLKDLLKDIEAKYPGFLDKADYVFVCGGGSTLFKSTDDQFIRIPFNDHEYYNSLGEYLFGIMQIKKG